MTNILITGARGFIGSHLVKHLSQRYNILHPFSSELNLTIKEDVDKYIKSNDIQFIIHSASYGVKITSDAKMEDVTKPNLIMFNNLADFVSNKCPMIVLGSGAEYDKRNALSKIKEDDFGKDVPQDPYGYSKYLISKEIEKKDNILNLRIFGIYGKGENSTRLATSIIKNNAEHQAIVLNQNVVFDFIYIEDFCKIVETFINDFPKEKFINVSPTISIEIKEIAEIINKISDFKSEIIFKKEGLDKEYTANNSLLLSLLGDFEFISYENGISQLYEGIK